LGNAVGGPGDEVGGDPVRLGRGQIGCHPALGGGDGQDVGVQHIAEGGHDPGRGHREADVGTAAGADLAVVLVSGQAVGDLDLVGADRQLGRRVGVDPVTVRVDEPGQHAAGVPVTGAAELVLVRAGGGDD